MGGHRMRMRWLIVLLVVGVALDLLISVALFYAVDQARRASSEAHLIKVAAYETCLSGNDTRAADLRRWHDIETLLRNGRDTPELQAFIAGIERANGQADSTRDCSSFAP